MREGARRIVFWTLLCLVLDSPVTAYCHEFYVRISGHMFISDIEARGQEIEVHIDPSIGGLELPEMVVVTNTEVSNLDKHGIWSADERSDIRIYCATLNTGLPVLPGTNGKSTTISLPFSQDFNYDQPDYQLAVLLRDRDGGSSGRLLILDKKKFETAIAKVKKSKASSN